MTPIFIIQPEHSGIYKAFVDMVIPVCAAFVGAIAGGVFVLIGGWLAGRQSHSNNLEHARIQKNHHINGVLLAIHSELVVLKKYYMANSGAMLEALKEGENYNTYFSLNQKYFIVYPNNTDIVGQIEDEGLVKSIVITYNAGNFLIESYGINNWYLDLEKDARGFAVGPLQNNRARHTLTLKHLHNTLLLETAALLEKIDAYRANHPV